MVECGLTWAKVLAGLLYDLGGLEGCLISHEHLDHCTAIHDVKQAGIDIYASGGTLDKLLVPDGRRVNVVENETLIRLPSFEVFCFNVNHDAAEPLGFVIRERETNEFLLFATDTSHIEQRFAYPFAVVAIECSYDAKILHDRVDRQDIHESLAKRLLTSHMEKQNCMKYLEEFCDLSRCHEIHLLHMSGDNMDKRQAVRDFEERFFIETVVFRVSDEKGKDSAKCQRSMP